MPTINASLTNYTSEITKNNLMKEFINLPVPYNFKLYEFTGFVAEESLSFSNFVKNWNLK
jgi:hypothetical protein